MPAGEAVAALRVEHADFRFKGAVPGLPEVFEEAPAKNPRVRPARKNVREHFLHAKPRHRLNAPEKNIRISIQPRHLALHFKDAGRRLVDDRRNALSPEVFERLQILPVAPHDDGGAERAARIGRRVRHDAREFVERIRGAEGKKSGRRHHEVDILCGHRLLERLSRKKVHGKAVLGEPPGKVADRFVDEGAVVPGRRIGENPHAHLLSPGRTFFRPGLRRPRRRGKCGAAHGVGARRRRGGSPLCSGRQREGKRKKDAEHPQGFGSHPHDDESLAVSSRAFEDLFFRAGRRQRPKWILFDLKQIS